MQHHLLQHDVIIVVETKMRAGQDHHLPECLAAAFTQHVINRPATVGCGGGLLVLVRSSMAATLTVRDAPNGVVWIRLDANEHTAQARRQGNRGPASLHILGCYLPPEGSAIYGKPQVGNPWDVLQQHISRQLRPGEQLLLLGDFNARTGGLAEHGDLAELQHALPGLPELAAVLQRDPLPPRRQADTQHNEFGNQLLALLAGNGCCIFNGRCPGDNGGYTSCSPRWAAQNGEGSTGGRGCATVDYIAGSVGLLTQIDHFHITPGIDSDHSMLSLQLRWPGAGHGGAAPAAHQGQEQSSGRCWNTRVSQRCTEQLQARPIKDRLRAVMALTDPTEATTALLTILGDTLSAAQPAPRAATSPAKPADASWYTAECRQLGRVYRREHHRCPFSAACKEARKGYTACIRRCKRAAQVEAMHALKQQLIEAPRRFWQSVKGRRTRQHLKGSITGWQQYVTTLLGTPPVTNTAQHGQWPVLKHVPNDNDLNAPFSMQELQDVLSKLKRDKAADLQGLRAELFVDCGVGVDELGAPCNALEGPLLHLCNLYLANGMVTAPVATAWVQPIPKGSTPTVVSEGGMEGVDDAQIFDQHRCITIGSLLAKVFTMLLDKRMKQYLEPGEWSPQHVPRGLQAQEGSR